MRVLLLSSFFYPHYGGSERYMEELYVSLIKANSTIATDVVCYNTDQAVDKEKYRGLNIYRVPCWVILPGQFALPNPVALILLIKRLSSQYKYDIVHSNTRFFDHSWYAPLVAKALGAKSVLTDHCANHPLAKLKLVTAISGVFDRFSLAICSQSYDMVIATNKATQKFLRKYSFKSPQLIYGGVDSNYFKPGIKKPLTITFVGRMIKSKGPQVLLEVAKKITTKYPQAHFVFAGGGELFNKLSADADKHIQFTGPLSSKEVAKLLSQTDIFVHPSIHPEGFPNVILEAGSCGCAVIATDQGGTKEIIINNKTGLLVEPTVDSLLIAIEKLILDQTLKSKLAKALQVKIRQDFDWKKIAQQFQQLIKTELNS
ncbi:MAG: glycosyltransferase family 4 protein [Candidatus Daviesbacteria bacterium]|nr:glycosyltransferase family 4 protein [Candidatus Daviesbacteria bacterium]